MVLAISTKYSSALLREPVEPLDVTCPHCKAGPVKPCLTTLEKPMSVCHTARHERALRAHAQPFILDGDEVAVHYAQLEKAVHQHLERRLPLVPGTSSSNRGGAR